MNTRVKAPSLFISIVSIVLLAGCFSPTNDTRDRSSLDVSIAGAKSGSVTDYDLSITDGHLPVFVWYTNSEGEDGFATVYFTVDGSEPSTASPNYQSGVSNALNIFSNYSSPKQPLRIRVLVVGGSLSETADVTVTPFNWPCKNNDEVRKGDAYFKNETFGYIAESYTITLLVKEAGTLSWSSFNESLGSISFAYCPSGSSTFTNCSSSSFTVVDGDKLRISISSGSQYRPSGPNDVGIKLQLD